jgi:hypothetical protein
MNPFRSYRRGGDNYTPGPSPIEGSIFPTIRFTTGHVDDLTQDSSIAL